MVSLAGFCLLTGAKIVTLDGDGTSGFALGGGIWVVAIGPGAAELIVAVSERITVEGFNGEVVAGDEAGVPTGG